MVGAQPRVRWSDFKVPQDNAEITTSLFARSTPVGLASSEQAYLVSLETDALAPCGGNQYIVLAISI